MSNSLNCTCQQPCYSGITINITNPSTTFPPAPNVQDQSGDTYTANPNQKQISYINRGEYLEPVNNGYINSENNSVIQNNSNELSTNPQNYPYPIVYPREYYINDYKGVLDDGNSTKDDSINNASDKYAEKNYTETSKELIEELDRRNMEQKELEKNGKKTKVVSLTNEYIMSLENYLNNPNTDIRLMASKEILTRLDEDRSRYDDAALNALLNKMLQDPNKLIRIAAMSAFSSELASGNDYTVQLLNQIQQNPNSDPEDVLEASQILLKRSASTEVRYTPVVQDQKVEETQE